MKTETRTTDAKGRVCLPKAFANATVVIEHKMGAIRVRGLTPELRIGSGSLYSAPNLGSDWRSGGRLRLSPSPGFESHTSPRPIARRFSTTKIR